MQITTHISFTVFTMPKLGRDFRNHTISDTDTSTAGVQEHGNNSKKSLTPERHKKYQQNIGEKDQQAS
jgi:hypothetical protein